MRRLAVPTLLMTLLMSLAAMLVVALAGPATAGVSCHQINAKGVGQDASQDGEPLIRTVAQIRGGGLLQGTTEAAFSVTGPTTTGVAFAGPITFTTNRGMLTVAIAGSVDFSTGGFAASGDVTGATGKLAGATGTLTFAGVQDLSDASGSFTETVTGEICVNLGGNGKK